MELSTIIRKQVLANALKYNGKANAGAVMGAVVGECPDAKSDMKSLAKQVNAEIQTLISSTMQDMQQELQEKFPEMLEKKEKKDRDELKELDNVKGQVIMRFAPSPSGPMHIGHAITGGLTSAYAKKYNGKFILRIEDTNSDNIDPDAYEQLPIDAAWIFGNVSEVWIQSDRMLIYYSYVKKFLDLDAVYVCTCSSEQFKQYADAMQDCPCRALPKIVHAQRWEQMFDTTAMKEGDAVVRFKASMQDKNPAMRDFPLVRINDSEHPRQGLKYRVWPLMNLCVTVDDIEGNMTHIIRAKDHADNAKRQFMMYQALGLEDQFPQTYFLGRYNFEGLEISCSKTKAKIKAGEFTGWDDIRIPFLQALKRRGYQPEAFIKYTKLTGLSPVDKTIPGTEFFKSINFFNKELIDKTAKRLFFMHDYEKITITDAPHQLLQLRYHPEHDLGIRSLEVQDEFLIQKSDLHMIKEGELCRFMDCLNFRKQGNEFVFDSLDYDTFKASGKKIMHYLPAYGNVAVEILMDDASVLTGLGEHNISHLKVGEIVQFERFGFCRLDAIEKNATTGNHLYKFWFTHR